MRTKHKMRIERWKMNRNEGFMPLKRVRKYTVLRRKGPDYIVSSSLGCRGFQMK